MFFSVAEVVGQVVALGFQRIVVFVLHLPAGPYDLNDVRFGDLVMGGKGVFINDLAVIPGSGQLAPVDIQGILAIAQRQLIDEAVGIGIALFAFAAFDLEGLDIAGGFQSRHPFIQRLVGIGLAHQDKIQLLADDGFAQRLFAIQIIT